MIGQIDDIERILHTEDLRLKQLTKIVENALKEEELLTSNIYALEQEEDKKTTRANRIADRVAEFGGSWRFIGIFFLILATWIIINIILPLREKFDPYPFILLNLFLSCIAAMQAPIIMMSQNRKEERDRKRAQNDYMINLKAEIEIRNLHKKMDMLIAEQMKDMFEIQKVQADMLRELKEKLDTHLGNQKKS